LNEQLVDLAHKRLDALLECGSVMVLIGRPVPNPFAQILG
jgi:hypothetical protein